MLVLGRRCDESIQIGDDITVTVVRIRSGEVRLGISAPRDIPVSRPDSSNIKKLTNHDAVDA